MKRFTELEQEVASKLYIDGIAEAAMAYNADEISKIDFRITDVKIAEVRPYEFASIRLRFSKNRSKLLLDYKIAAYPNRRTRIAKCKTTYLMEARDGKTYLISVKSEAQIRRISDHYDEQLLALTYAYAKSVIRAAVKIGNLPFTAKLPISYAKICNNMKDMRGRSNTSYKSVWRG